MDIESMLGLGGALITIASIWYVVFGVIFIEEWLTDSIAGWRWRFVMTAVNLAVFGVVIIRLISMAVAGG